MDKVLKTGAEARLTLKNGKVVKERIKKGYRLEQIDLPLRKTRTKREARLIDKARRAKVNVPRIYSVEGFTIEMDFIDGERIDKVLTKSLAKKVGEAVAKLHSDDIIHGDLTTSNILVKDNELYFIDFGLGEISNSHEKKGVDLKVLEDAITATQGKNAPGFIDEILNAYKKNATDSELVLSRLEKIEKRGRYKER